MTKIIWAVTLLQNQSYSNLKEQKIHETSELIHNSTIECSLNEKGGYSNKSKPQNVLRNT